VLQFEQEEERILQEVEKFPVDMRIEDSGSLQGLADALYEGAGYDIVEGVSELLMPCQMDRPNS
jgi:hypothetical protein